MTEVLLSSQEKLEAIKRAELLAPMMGDGELADALEAEPLPLRARWEYLHEAARRLRISQAGRD